MDRTAKKTETLRISVATRWLTIKIDGVGRTTVLGAIASLTVLGLFYIIFIVS